MHLPKHLLKSQSNFWQKLLQQSLQNILGEFATGKKVAERNRVALEQKKNQETPAAPAKQREQKVDRKRQR